MLGWASILIRLNQASGVLATAKANGTVGLALFPNPGRGGVALTGTAAHALVEVSDALGRRVLTATANASEPAQLALPTALPVGLYVVRAGSQVRRLVVD